MPPLLVLNEPVPGDCAGHTVKPGCVEPASLGALTSAGRVDVLHRHGRSTRRELRLRERIDLCAGEAVRNHG